MLPHQGNCPTANPSANHGGDEGVGWEAEPLGAADLAWASRRPNISSSFTLPVDAQQMGEGQNVRQQKLFTF
jgi:hypothetical protein